MVIAALCTARVRAALVAATTGQLPVRIARLIGIEIAGGDDVDALKLECIPVLQFRRQLCFQLRRPRLVRIHRHKRDVILARHREASIDQGFDPRIRASLAFSLGQRR